MLISVKKRFIFIASSKTASTSIESALMPYAEIIRSGSPERKHCSWKEARKEYNFLFKIPPYKPQNFFKFGVVREPVEWIISWYNYRYMNNTLANPLPKDMNFEQFWNSNDWVKRKCQKDSFSNNSGICRFDLIIPHEKVNQAFPIVVNHLKLGKKVILPYKNKTVIKNITRNSLDPELVSKINAYYQQDFNFWMEWMENIDSSLEKLQ
ncbi:MAG: sulfotransferase family 2 domain-containing protein [Methylobacter sp.]|nr:sulfotransferase family 2 domain-containing protein [Methylobacter sp.]